MNQTSPLPILWSFRRCPYAMRARLAIAAAGIAVELREILLPKPKAAAAAEAADVSDATSEAAEA